MAFLGLGRLDEDEQQRVNAGGGSLQRRDEAALYLAQSPVTREKRGRPENMLGRRRCRDDAGTDLVRRSSGPWRAEHLRRGRERLGTGERRGDMGFGRERRVSFPWIEQVESHSAGWASAQIERGRWCYGLARVELIGRGDPDEDGGGSTVQVPIF